MFPVSSSCVGFHMDTNSSMMPAHKGVTMQCKRMIHKVQSMNSRHCGAFAEGTELRRPVSTSQSARSTDPLLNSSVLEMGSKGSECEV